MKLVLALLLLPSLSIADQRPSDKANRKGEPPADKLQAAAGEAFAKAKAADEAGKLDEAARLYRKALAIQPHPHTQYNLADVLRRNKDIKGAIDAYKKYLEMDPQAKDRAEVERLIAQLDATPGTMIIEHEESNVQLFLNGDPIKVTPVPDKRNPSELHYSLDLPASDYTVELVTAISYDDERCFVYHGSKRACRLRPKPRVDGNVIISGPPHMSRMSLGRSGQPRIHLKGRFQLDPGRHSLMIAPSDQQQCKPLVIDVAPGDVITYIYVETPKKWPDRRDGCVDLKHKRRVLKF